MAAAHEHSWHPGERLLVRGAVWRVIERTRYIDCESLRLRAARDAASTRTVLLPFDRPRPLENPPAVRVVRPRGWVRRLRSLAAAVTPAGGFAPTALRDTLSILPYQLEPALLMRRYGVARVLIADAVGLGKTIQAGLLLAGLASESDGLRAIVVVPAGLRQQWTRELATHFGLESIVASSMWLARAAADLPGGVNPWALPGIYVTSSDLIKRPEVLRPLEEVAWDAVVVDEAHEAGLATARRAAVHAVACRSRRVVLLTATPHGGDAGQFAALCEIGTCGGASPPIVLFRRTRSATAHGPRRSTILPVRLSPCERRMHRLLEQYTARLYEEACARGDSQARLVAIVLRKRALSSAASVATSCTRRLALLERHYVQPFETQLVLPLGDEDSVDDAEPDAVLGAPGLADSTRERQWLLEIAAAAHTSSARESKIGLLRRMLRRIHEPAIVFTEYRDTLERLRRELSPVRPDLQVLHGGMELRDRAGAQDLFNTRAPLLIATDAASQGLNLHSRSRLVIHFELPWSPARLEQRTGRVDRHGQSRRVHEILLVARDTAEALVLAPLLARAARTRSALTQPWHLVDVLAESQVAAAVMEGLRPVADPPASKPSAFCEPPATLAEEAAAEATRLTRVRRAGDAGIDIVYSGTAASSVLATCMAHVRGLAAGIFAIYRAALRNPSGAIVHGELVVAHCALADRVSRMPPAALRRLVNRFRESDEPSVREMVRRHITNDLERASERWRDAATAMARRERAITECQSSVARQLVQAGLFDQRSVRASAARSHTAGLRLDEAAHRTHVLVSSTRVDQSVNLEAVLVVANRSWR